MFVQFADAKVVNIYEVFINNLKPEKADKSEKTKKDKIDFKVFKKKQADQTLADENDSKKFNLQIESILDSKILNPFATEKTIEKRKEIRKLKASFKERGKKISNFEAQRLILLRNSQPETFDDYLAQAKDIKNSERKIEIPQREKDKLDEKLINLPKVKYEIEKFNDLPGSYEIDLSDLKTEKQIKSKALVSPDFTQLVYSNVYFYPSSNQASSELFRIKLDQSILNKTERILKAISPNSVLIASVGINACENGILHSLTPVDFNKNSTKVLFKEKISSFTDGLWRTNLYVYDFEKNEITNLDLLHEAMSYICKKNFSISLEKHKYNIMPVGWSSKNPNCIIAYGLIYKKGNASPFYIGAFLIDDEGTKVRFLQNANQEVDLNGFTLKEKGLF